MLQLQRNQGCHGLFCKNGQFSFSSSWKKLTALTASKAKLRLVTKILSLHKHSFFVRETIYWEHLPFKKIIPVFQVQAKRSVETTHNGHDIIGIIRWHPNPCTDGETGRNMRCRKLHMSYLTSLGARSSSLSISILISLVGKLINSRKVPLHLFQKRKISRTLLWLIWLPWNIVWKKMYMVYCNISICSTSDFPVVVRQFKIIQ